MPRPKRVRVTTLAQGPSPDARAEVWLTIDHLMGVVNQQQPMTPKSPGTARMLDAAFTAISRGEAGGFVNWAPWAALAMVNLASLVKGGACYLRRCPRCGLWFLSRDKRRFVCAFVLCKRLRARARTAATRRRLRDDNRRARERVHAKGT